MRNESNVFRITFIVHDNGKQTSGLPSVASFVPLGCSSQSFLLPFHRPLATKKKSSSEKEQLFFCCLRSQSPHGRFLRSSGLLRPQHKPARKMRVSVCVHRPLLFQRLLFRPAIGVCSVVTLHLNKERQRLTYIFSPPLHAASPSLHYARASFRSRSSVAVRLPQHRVALLEKNSVKTPFFLRCFGVLVEPYNRLV